jgi:prepilin-type processing-associated H-X9-DG protein
MLLSDAISASAAGAFADGHVRVSLSDDEEGVAILVGPMEEGAGARIRESFDVPGTGGSLEGLAEAVEVSGGADGEYLAVRIGRGQS